ncbi:hypothetical protein CVU82_01895 [Candidatus Falkowbacteria bacterium HGW-Falkowbacteria-1]|uniref:Calcineurin-like phosphoesterase domain-containing protein n=1 Tax=Candidatus Falkowbacteria bacterium HGW-Falkowbacteria-1 TaxID=2013768 RepID=A0A2N2E9C2_9BACT|nr:MAG: hypothetical protein CVU82_01895 [Candidatus Falkowbacteria bacterium HGW-Falkowbacteria-1]
MTRILISFIYYGFYLIFPLLFLLIYRTYKKRKVQLEIIVLMLISFVFIWARFVEPNFLITKNYNLNIQNNSQNTLKVVVFSDIHLGAYNDTVLLKRAIKKINKAKPDLVLIPGDFVYFANKENLVENFSVLKDLKMPKIAILGNHDYGKNENNMSKLISSSLESAGVLVIDNKIKILEIKNKNIEIVGLGDLWVGNPDYSILKPSEFEDKIDLTILLTHNPDSIYELKKDSSEIKDINLMVSGHTHAGQMRIPFLYKHVIPSSHGFDKEFYTIDGINLFVTPGIGNVVLPLRIFDFPEISVLNIGF